VSGSTSNDGHGDTSLYVARPRMGRAGGPPGMGGGSPWRDPPRSREKARMPHSLLWG
jgi:hypothetical protein